MFILALEEKRDGGCDSSCGMGVIEVLSVVNEDQCTFFAVAKDIRHCFLLLT